MDNQLDKSFFQSVRWILYANYNIYHIKYVYCFSIYDFYKILRMRGVALVNMVFTTSTQITSAEPSASLADPCSYTAVTTRAYYTFWTHMSLYFGVENQRRPILSTLQIMNARHSRYTPLQHSRNPQPREPHKPSKNFEIHNLPLFSQS